MAMPPVMKPGMLISVIRPSHISYSPPMPLQVPGKLPRLPEAAGGGAIRKSASYRFISCLPV